MKLVKEPLLHFLLIGAFFFVVYSLLNSESKGEDFYISVDEDRIIALVESYKITWQRAPSAEELKALIDDYVLEEAYYRQALALNLDKGDSVIRRRLRQKMEFLANAMMESAEPTDTELTMYMTKNIEKYTVDDSYSFEQVFINARQSSQKLSARVAQVQADILKKNSPISDPALLASSYVRLTRHQIDNLFGQNFSENFDDLELNKWYGPIGSGVGMHFIYLTERIQAPLPSLSAVRDQVLSDWRFGKDNEAKEQLRRNVLKEFRVEVALPQGMALE